MSLRLDGRTFCTSSSRPWRAGRSPPARFGLPAPLQAGAPGLRSTHGPAGDDRRSPGPGSGMRVGFLVLNQRHRPHRPRQPRCAPQRRHRPQRSQQMSPRDRRGRGRRRGVPGL